MSARHFSAPATTAFRLAATLEQYEQHLGVLTSNWPDAAIYERVSRELAEMRLLCAGLPQLSVPWMHLQISHTQLVHCLWSSSADADFVEGCKALHLAAIRALRGRCLDGFSRVEGSPAVQPAGPRPHDRHATTMPDERS